MQKYVKPMLTIGNIFSQKNNFVSICDISMKWGIFDLTIRGGRKSEMLQRVCHHNTNDFQCFVPLLQMWQIL